MSALSEELVRISEQGLSAVLATIVEAEGSDRIQAGAKCLVVDGKSQTETISDSRAVERIVRESEAILSGEKSKLIAIEIPETGRLQVFFEVMLAPPKLIVVGAGHIAVPLVQIRFPAADEVLVGDMAQMLKEMTITPSCYIILITRGHKYDEPCLRQILHSKAKYIGMIGSRRRIKACFQRFRDEEKIAEEVIERVYAPIGLDIATETPAEIALSILAEVVKVRRGGKAASLSGH